MPSRLDEYERLLVTLRERDYRFTSVGRYADQLPYSGEISEDLVILRHDVDTDIPTARRMFEIERGLGIDSSYFFRLSTLAPELMTSIASSGSEASYHFEEIAIIAKKRGLRSRAEVFAAMPEIQDLFAENLGRLRRLTGLPMTTIASHGDFVNRRLGVTNYELLDEKLRRELSISHEVYDNDLQEGLEARIADRPPPLKWHPISPVEASGNRLSKIYILIHPKQWHANIVANLRELWVRTSEGLIYDLRIR